MQTASPILEKLDRYNFYITHRLFREATRAQNGMPVKDLQYLNRDLSKVIMIDTREGSFVRASPRKGEEGDKAGVYPFPCFCVR